MAHFSCTTFGSFAPRCSTRLVNNMERESLSEAEIFCWVLHGQQLYIIGKKNQE
jgi:hypothetical protein